MNEAIISLDLETTGLDISKDRIVQIACVKFNIDGIIEEKNTLVNPGIPIPKEATEIHGITNEIVEDKPTFKQLAKSILSFIQDRTILTYNGNSFDIPLLYTEFNRAGIEWNYSKSAFIDACGIYKRNEPRDLDAAMKFYYNEDLIRPSHSALVDAKATLKVFAEQCRRYDMKDTLETALYSNYDKPFVDMGGWFDANLNLAKGKCKGTKDKGFIKWMLKLPDLLPDARRICEKILNK